MGTPGSNWGFAFAFAFAFATTHSGLALFARDNRHRRNNAAAPPTGKTVAASRIQYAVTPMLVSEFYLDFARKTPSFSVGM